MRESFVFHDSYISDIPEELHDIYCGYVVRYGLSGIEPVFSDWRELKIWNNIKERIDADAEAYNSVTLKKKLGLASGHFKAGKASQAEIMLLKENGFNFRTKDFTAENISDSGKESNDESMDFMTIKNNKSDKSMNFMTIKNINHDESMNFMTPKNNTDTDTNTRRVFVSDPLSLSEFEYESVGNEACASTETTADFSTDIPQKKTEAPSLDDVKSYIEEKDLNVNEDDFWEYYSGNPGKDWKRMLLSWSRRERNPEARKSNNAARYDFARKGG